MITRKLNLRFKDVPLNYNEEEEVRAIAEIEKLPFILAKEKYFEKRDNLDKWMR